MNEMLFALMIVTSNGGVQEAPNTFATMQACESASAKLKVDSYCIQKQHVDIDKQMTKMVRLMGKMMRQMDEEFAKNN